MTKKEKREAKAAAGRSSSGGGSQIAVVIGIVVAIFLFTYSGGGAAQQKWVPAQGVITDAYTEEPSDDSGEAASYAVVRFTDGIGKEREETALQLVTAMDDRIGETVDIEYRASNGVRIAGNFVDTKDTTTRNLILAMVAVIGVYFLSEIIKRILPPEMVYEKLTGKKAKKD